VIGQLQSGVQPIQAEIDRNTQKRSFADLVFFLHVQVRDELRKETLQLASELYFLFMMVF
jgi:hypothetical protein